MVQLNRIIQEQDIFELTPQRSEDSGQYFERMWAQWELICLLTVLTLEPGSSSSGRQQEIKLHSQPRLRIPVQNTITLV